MNKTTIRISKKLKSIAKRLDMIIKNIAGEHVGFMLIVYTPERASYISSVSREDNVKQLEYLLKTWKEGEADVKAHEVNESE